MKDGKALSKSFDSILSVASEGGKVKMAVGSEIYEMKSPTHAAKTIRVVWPGEGKDANQNIQKAITQAKEENGPVVLKFEEGKVYHTYPETAFTKTGIYISNAQTQSENPDGVRYSALLLEDMQDITVDGNGSTLLVHGVMTPVFFHNAQNILIKNLHVDYARPTVSEYTVTEQGDGYVKIKIHEDSLYQLQDKNNDGTMDNILWLGEKNIDGTARYWSHNAILMQEYNPEAGTYRRTPFYGFGTAIEDEGNNVLKLVGANNNYKVGCTYGVRNGFRDQVGSLILKSKNIVIEDCSFHYMHGLGFVGQRSENLTISRISCTPSFGRVTASSADFIQISGCKGTITVNDSHFSGAQDDTINVHGTHLQIVDFDKGLQKIIVEFKEPRSWSFEVFEPGDTIEFISNIDLLPYGSNTVASVNPISKTQIELTLVDPLPNNIRVNADVVENATWTPDVVIADNLSEYIPTRGILCTTRGKVLIEGNTFRNHPLAAILLEDDANGWFESGYITDMTIRNNVFENCSAPQIYSNPRTSVSTDPEKTVHSNITVENNTFTGPATNLKFISVKNVKVVGNTFSIAGGTVTLSGCNGYDVNGNANYIGLACSKK